VKATFGQGSGSRLLFLRWLRRTAFKALPQTVFCTSPQATARMLSHFLSDLRTNLHIGWSERTRPLKLPYTYSTYKCVRSAQAPFMSCLDWRHSQKRKSKQVFPVWIYSNLGTSVLWIIGDRFPHLTQVKRFAKC